MKQRTNKKHISVVVTNYKKLDLLLRNMQSLRSSCPNCEIIVVNGEASRRDEKIIKEKFSDVIYIAFSKNIGFAKLVNAGLKRAKGDFLMVLNSDILIEPDTLTTLVGYLKKHPGVGLVGPKIYSPDGSLATSPRRFYSFPLTVLARRTTFGKTPWGRRILARHLMQDFDHDQTTSVDWILGEAMMTSRKHLRRVGLMDERFFLYFEDVDWCFRFWKAGLKVVYCADTSVRELEPTGEVKKAHSQGVRGALNKYNRIHIKSYLRFILKHGFHQGSFGL